MRRKQKNEILISSKEFKQSKIEHKTLLVWLKRFIDPNASISVTEKGFLIRVTEKAQLSKVVLLVSQVQRDGYPSRVLF